MNDSNGYVWEHLVAQLEELITSGHFKPGQAFPSALRISRDFQVGLGTARKALRVLERQGRIVVVPSKGSFVTPQVPEFKMPGPPADA
ncbi:winged helix-turn-helix domain-containing protein [Nonomuraea sp. NPDC050202]|uniref:winged helix-turn-helix domain-containing protein n=1 Tax=Nonomuraea sp. NPDC050202 TaxID=3155035 RepID=UPI00340433EC